MAKRIAFVSTIPFDWGGSEELWAETARVLVGRGYQVDLFKEIRSRQHEKIRGLVDQGVRFVTPSGYRLPSLLRLRNRVLPFRRQTSKIAYFSQALRKAQPDLVVISQGWNWDGLDWAMECQRGGLPFVLISHQANIRGWPADSDVEEVSRAHLNARASFYVARRVLERTEEMIGARVPHGEIVRNPYNVSTEAALPWPDDSMGLKLACVGRFEFKDKGQDVLIRVMGREKWRARALSISFFGDGINKEGMKRLIEYTGASGCEIKGHTDSIEGIWKDHHALILPSREEGLPLVIVEAMHCGRPCVVSDVVGNAELLQEGKSGFICPAPTGDLLDETMERAWAARGSWETMGQFAAESVREQIPKHPELEFAARLESLMT